MMNPSPLFEVVQSIAGNNVHFEILQYRELAHSDLLTRQQQLGQRLQQVRVILQDSKIISDDGVFHFSKGNINVDMKFKGENSEKIKRLKKTVTHNETLIKPAYEGTGEIYFKPEWNHYFIFQLNAEEIIIEKNMYVCSELNIEITEARPKNVNPASHKNKDLLKQVQLSGTGICILRSPVPIDEIVVMELQDEAIQTEQGIVLYRSPTIEFTVENPTKSIWGNLGTTRDFLRTYRGTGTIWIAPTHFLYDEKEEEKEED